MYTRRGPPKRKVSTRLRQYIDTHPSSSQTDSTLLSTDTDTKSRPTRSNSPRSTFRTRVRSPLPFRPRRQPASERPDAPASRSREWFTSWFCSPRYTRDNGRRRENQSHLPSQPRDRSPVVDSRRRSRSDRANRSGTYRDDSLPRVARAEVRERETEHHGPRYHPPRLPSETPRTPRIHTIRPELRFQEPESSQAPRRTRDTSVFSDRRPQRRGRRISPVRDGSSRQPSSIRTTRPISDDTPRSSVHFDIPIPSTPVRPGTPMPRTEPGTREQASQPRVIYRSPRRHSYPTVILRRPSGTEPEPDIITREPRGPRRGPARYD
ncbi:hypothetical protein N7488_007027 [Penicillium malachiteum]|nr:hypothetical protein N7488_007027 [Penicillium malachiteum]